MIDLILFPTSKNAAEFAKEITWKITCINVLKYISISEAHATLSSTSHTPLRFFKSFPSENNPVKPKHSHSVDPLLLFPHTRIHVQINGSTHTKWEDVSTQHKVMTLMIRSHCLAMSQAGYGTQCETPPPHTHTALQQACQLYFPKDLMMRVWIGEWNGRSWPKTPCLRTWIVIITVITKEAIWKRTP